MKSFTQECSSLKKLSALTYWVEIATETKSCLLKTVVTPVYQNGNRVSVQSISNIMKQMQ